MSRFSSDYDDEYFPNQAALWQANARRALKGKKGRKALAELRDALRALPEKRLIAGALCTVGGLERPDIAEKLAEEERRHEENPQWGNWYRDEATSKVKEEGEGVCAIGAYLWHREVKAGTDPEEAFAKLPTLLDIDGGDYETARAGHEAGLTFTLAWQLAWRNDEEYDGLSPEERYESFMRWLDEELGDAVAA